MKLQYKRSEATLFCFYRIYTFKIVDFLMNYFPTQQNYLQRRKIESAFQISKRFVEALFEKVVSQYIIASSIADYKPSSIKTQYQ
jgi:hypothetical protein